jgi:hypothetical protein
MAMTSKVTYRRGFALRQPLRLGRAAGRQRGAVRDRGVDHPVYLAQRLSRDVTVAAGGIKSDVPS